MHRLCILLPLLIIFFGLSSCHTTPPTSLITIDIDEALKNKAELKLSEIAEDVEFIQLHGMSTDTYVHNWSWQYYVGDKVICVFNLKPYEFLLFSRDGKFIRKIGSGGKGPGEFLGESLVYSVDEVNETILLADNSSKKFLLYRFSGEFIKERAYKTFTGINITRAVDMCFDPEGNLNIKNQIAPNSQGICYTILKLDRELNLLKGIKPERPPAPGPGSFYMGSNQIYPFGADYRFWTPEKDTVFQLIKNQALPLYHFKISDRPSFEEHWTNDNRGHTFIEKILETRDYLLIYGNQGTVPFCLAHQKQTGKTVRIFSTGKCGLSFGDKAGIENDLFGYSPVYLSDFATIDHGKPILILNPGLVDSIDEFLKIKLTDCLKSAKVLMPDKRDELVRLIENLDENSGPILMVIKLL